MFWEHNTPPTLYIYFQNHNWLKCICIEPLYILWWNAPSAQAGYEPHCSAPRSRFLMQWCCWGPPVWSTISHLGADRVRFWTHWCRRASHTCSDHPAEQRCCCSWHLKCWARSEHRSPRAKPAADWQTNLRLWSPSDRQCFLGLKWACSCRGTDSVDETDFWCSRGSHVNWDIDWSPGSLAARGNKDAREVRRCSGSFCQLLNPEAPAHACSPFLPFLFQAKYSVSCFLQPCCPM